MVARMIPGQKLSKWTWLMEDVTVRGIVRDAVDPNDHREPKQIGAELGGADAFDLEVDPNYRHLIAISGNNPTPFRSPPGCIHVEGYHHDFDNPDWINRVAPHTIRRRGRKNGSRLMGVISPWATE